MMLSTILGSDTTEATIIMYAFIQQNIIFEALAGLRGQGTSVYFLSYLTTIFSMIGLLVMIFSPSLWKIKYVASWLFIFVLVTLGGASGPEFGYKFANIPLANTVLDKPVNDTNPIGSVNSVTQGYNALQEQKGFRILTNSERVVQSTGSSKTTDGQSFVEVDNNGLLSNVRIIGFYPQVVILHVTNVLRDGLQAAMNELVENDDFQKLTKFAKAAVNAKIPDAQTDMIINLFHKECGGAIPGMSTSEILRTSDLGPLQNQLSRAYFNGHNGTVNVSNISSQNNPHIIEPKLAFNEVTAIQPGQMAYRESTVNLLSDPKLAPYIRAYAVNRAASDSSYTSQLFNPNLKPGTSTEYDPSNPIFARYSLNKETIMNNLVLPAIDTRKNNSEKLDEATTAILNSGVLKTEPVKYLLVASPIAKSELYGQTQKATEDMKIDLANADIACQEATGSPGNGFGQVHCITTGNTNRTGDAAMEKSGIHSQQEAANRMLDGTTGVSPHVEAVGNCYEMAEFAKRAIDMANQVNLKDFEEQTKFRMTMNGYTGSDPYSNQALQKASMSIKNGKMDKEYASDYALLQALDEKQRRCYVDASGSGCEKLQGEIDKMVDLYKKYQIENALSQSTQSTIQKDYLDGGASHLANVIGEGITSTFVAPVAWFGEIGASFKEGAYSVILPIIKNLILAFILVLTPILLCIGLIAPAWAPGLIGLTLISLIFIKFVGITMVLIDAILNLTRQVFETMYHDMTGNNEISSEYMSLLNAIWAMAYMASFAITAFLLFAAGNVKAVMGKMAGMDSTVKGLADKTVDTGWKMVKNGVGVVAPTMGNTLISSTALREGLTSATAGISTFTQAPNPISTLINQHEEKALANTKEADGIKANMTPTYDESTGTMTTANQAAYNRAKAISMAEYENPKSKEDLDRIFEEDKAAARDKNLIEIDDYKTKIENREDKDLRAFTKEEPEVTRLDDSIAKRIKGHLKSHGLEDNDMFNDRTVGIIDKDGNSISNRIKGVKSIITNDMFRSSLKALGHDNIADSGERAELRAKSRRLNVALANELGLQLTNPEVKSMENKDGTRTHTLNIKHDEMVYNLQQRLKNKGGAAVDTSFIRDYVNANLNVNANNQLSISDVITKQKSKPGRKRR